MNHVYIHFDLYLPPEPGYPSDPADYSHQAEQDSDRRGDQQPS